MTTVDLLEGYILKAGDNRPTLLLQLLEEENKEPMNLQGFTVDFKLKNNKTGEIVVNNPMTIANARNGIVKYEWSSAETSDAGLYNGEVTADDGTVTLTFPNDGYFQIDINELIE